MSRKVRSISAWDSAGSGRISAAQIEEAMREAGMEALPESLIDQLVSYAALLLRWNARLNLTSIRTSEEIVRRHFVESVFAARHLPQEIDTLLDFGSGAGFPGVPIALSRPEIQVTLAESQSKKAAFLREAVRNLSLDSEVYAGRVEDLPSSRTFDVVTLRAVDKMEEAILSAEKRARQVLAVLTTEVDAERYKELVPGFRWNEAIPMPQTKHGALLLGRRRVVPRIVPRGT